MFPLTFAGGMDVLHPSYLSEEGPGLYVRLAVGRGLCAELTASKFLLEISPERSRDGYPHDSCLRWLAVRSCEPYHQCSLCTPHAKVTLADEEEEAHMLL